MKCKYCGRYFDSKDEWKIHVLKEHAMVAIFGAEILHPMFHDPMGLNKKVKKGRINVEELMDKIRE
ncbi:hypothetical protein DRP05_01535 [Archaeoglobales archaeon]|nr:MAG: hypothetical protein DRP05_01535 [Archaeoglobales archaeon]